MDHIGTRLRRALVQRHGPDGQRLWAAVALAALPTEAWTALIDAVSEDHDTVEGWLAVAGLWNPALAARITEALRGLGAPASAGARVAVRHARDVVMGATRRSLVVPPPVSV